MQVLTSKCSVQLLFRKGNQEKWYCVGVSRCLFGGVVASWCAQLRIGRSGFKPSSPSQPLFGSSRNTSPPLTAGWTRIPFVSLCLEFTWKLKIAPSTRCLLLALKPITYQQIVNNVSFPRKFTASFARRLQFVTSIYFIFRGNRVWQSPPSADLTKVLQVYLDFFGLIGEI